MIKRMTKNDTCPICCSSNINTTGRFDQKEAIYQCANCKTLLKNNCESLLAVIKERKKV